MNDQTAFPNVPWIPRDHDANRAKIPPEIIDRFRGQYVAYSFDGSQILTGAPSWDELFQKLDEAGIEPGSAVLAYIDEM